MCDSCWCASLLLTVCLCVCVCARQAASQTALEIASTRSFSSLRHRGQLWINQECTLNWMAPPTGRHWMCRSLTNISFFSNIVVFSLHNVAIYLVSPCLPACSCFKCTLQYGSRPPWLIVEIQLCAHHVPPPPHWSQYIHLRVSLSHSQVNQTLPAVTTGVPHEKTNA